MRNAFTGHTQDIYSLDFAHDGHTIASGGGDRTVRLWNLETGLCHLVLTIEDGATTVAISPDTKLVAAGSLDNIVRVWDISTGYLLHRLEGHTDVVHSVAFSSNAHQLFSGSLDKTIKMWELNPSRQIAHDPKPPLEGGRCIKTFEGHRVCLVKSPNPLFP